VTKRCEVRCSLHAGEHDVNLTSGGQLDPKSVLVQRHELGKPVRSPSGAGDPQGELLDMRVEDGGESEWRPVMGRIGIQNLSRSERMQTSTECNRRKTAFVVQVPNSALGILGFS
jgi:hypothetical protein